MYPLPLGTPSPHPLKAAHLSAPWWPKKWALLKGTAFFQFIYQFSSVQSLSRVRLFATPWISACQASLSITNSQSSLKLMPVESVMPASHLILCCPLLLLPPIPLSIRAFSNESTLRMRWPKYWSCSFSISPSNEQLSIGSCNLPFIFLGLISCNRGD